MFAAPAHEDGVGGASGLAALASRLREPVDLQSVAVRVVGGGKQAAYLPGEKAVSTANEIFGFASVRALSFSRGRRARARGARPRAAAAPTPSPPAVERRDQAPRSRLLRAG